MRRLAIAVVFLAGELRGGTLSLSPAVVPLGGAWGQGTRQTLTLTNGTDRELTFVLEARDVVVQNGRRVSVPAGEIPKSIAATAVFTPARVTVPAGGAASVDVTLTLTPGAAHRAVVTLFRSTSPVSGTATAAIGTLLTFTLGEKVSLLPSDLIVRSQSPSVNAAFSQPLENDGTEPVVARGLAAILDAQGALVGRVPLAPRRLLPGERVDLSGEFAGELPPGRYRAVATVSFEGRALTRTGELVVP